MFSHVLRIHQCVRFLVILLIIFILIFLLLISFESSHYLKYPLYSYLNNSYRPKTFYDILNNTEDEQTSTDDYSIWCLHMANRLDKEKYLPQSPIIKAPPINSTRLYRLPYRYSQWQSSPSLERRFTPCEHNLAMRLLMIIERICRKHKITFMLSEGSLLGSFRHHDIIPWDDDLDIMIPLQEQTRFINIIREMNKTLIQHHILSNKKKKRDYYKIYFKNTPTAGPYSWNFPFVDIFLYERNGTHLWSMGEPDTIIEIKYVFPLMMRPFGDLWLPTPQIPQRFFNFDPYDNCKGHWWDHRREKGMKQISIKCNNLTHIYPFVERLNNQSNSTEILKINNTIIHTIVYN